MPVNRAGAMGGAWLPQPQVRGTGDAAQEAETIIPGDGTIGSDLYPICQQTYTLTKGSAAAIKLLAPSIAQSGTILTITTGSAFAHVVTATGLIQDGVTGGAKSTITFGAFIGASISLVASRQKWNVLGINVAPVT
jgi:hypothetical protein